MHVSCNCDLNIQRKLTNNPANDQLNTAIIRFTEVSKGAIKSSMKHGGQTYFPRTFFRLIMNALNHKTVHMTNHLVTWVVGFPASNFSLPHTRPQPEAYHRAIMSSYRLHRRQDWWHRAILDYNNKVYQRVWVL